MRRPVFIGSAGAGNERYGRYGPALLRRLHTQVFVSFYSDPEHWTRYIEE